MKILISCFLILLVHALQAQEPAVITPKNEEAARLRQPAPVAPVAPVVGDAVGELESLLAARPVVNESLSVEQAVAIALRESPWNRVISPGGSANGTCRLYRLRDSSWGAKCAMRRAGTGRMSRLSERDCR